MSLLNLKSRPGSALRKLLTVLCGIGLFLLLVGALGVWALGRFSPRLLDALYAPEEVEDALVLAHGTLRDDGADGRVHLCGGERESE